MLFRQEHEKQKNNSIHLWRSLHYTHHHDRIYDRRIMGAMICGVRTCRLQFDLAVGTPIEVQLSASGHYIHPVRLVPCVII